MLADSTCAQIGDLGITCILPYLLSSNSFGEEIIIGVSQIQGVVNPNLALIIKRNFNIVLRLVL